MRPTKSVDLPSGIKAEVVTGWTFDDYLQIEAGQMKMLKSATVGTDGRPTMQIDGSEMGASEILSVRLAVKKLTAADGTDIPVTDAVIKELDWNDGIALRDSIREMERASKKK